MALPPPRPPEWLPPNPRREEPISRMNKPEEIRKYYRVILKVVDEVGNGEEMEVFKTTFNIEEQDSVDIEDIREMFRKSYTHSPIPKLVVTMKPTEPAPDWPVYTIRTIEHS